MFLSDGRSMPVKIKNLGRLGVLVEITDLEEAMMEGDRCVVEHPLLDEAGGAQSERRRTVGTIVRVELEFHPEGIRRQMAVYFDGGAAPRGYEPNGTEVAPTLE